MVLGLRVTLLEGGINHLQWLFYLCLECILRFQDFYFLVFMISYIIYYKKFTTVQIPVYKGSARALIGTGLEATHYHGQDGLGDANLDLQVSLDQVQKQPAVTALLDLVDKYPGER